jgi:hypothetical protein
MAGRKFAVYFSWSRPRETGAPLGVLENRYPCLFEFRRAIWPIYEWAADPGNFSQEIAGFLDHVILFDFDPFTKLIQEATGQPVQMIQREGDAPPVRELDDDFLRDIDTLIVVSLDHLVTAQSATQGEIEAVRAFLNREGTCLVVCPHHDIGVVYDPARKDDTAIREVQYRHHGDRLVPSQQRIGGFARTLLTGIGLPVENRFGLSPAAANNGMPAPLIVYSDLDQTGVMAEVTTFNLHPHLPHLEIPPALNGKIQVLARQRINPAAPLHPFVEAGNTWFNALLHAPPDGERAGQVFICDATLWSSAFGGLSSLQNFWRNLAGLP